MLSGPRAADGNRLAGRKLGIVALKKNGDIDLLSPGRNEKADNALFHAGHMRIFTAQNLAAKQNFFSFLPLFDGQNRDIANRIRL